MPPKRSKLDFNDDVDEDFHCEFDPDDACKELEDALAFSDDDFLDDDDYPSYSDPESEAAHDRRPSGSFDPALNEVLGPAEIRLALALGVSAADVERSTGASVVAALCVAAASDGLVDGHWRGAFEWACSTGADFGAASLILPDAPVILAKLRGGPEAARDLLAAGFLPPQSFNFPSCDGEIEGSILHLLISEAPRCARFPDACRALAECSDPDARDGAGYTALGRLNREASKRRGSADWSEAFTVLASLGHDPSDLAASAENLIFDPALAPLCRAESERSKISKAMAPATARKSEDPRL